MMYGKAMLFDPPSGEAILHAATPAEAKRLGREIPHFNKDKWNARADEIVEHGNWLKFGQDPELSELLLSSEPKMLVEASGEDRIWGIGFWADEAEGREAEWGQNRSASIVT